MYNITPMPIIIPIRRDKEISIFKGDINGLSFGPGFFIFAFILTVVIGLVLMYFVFDGYLCEFYEWFIAFIIFTMIGFLLFMLPLILSDISGTKTSINSEGLLNMRKFINSNESWEEIFRKIDSYPLEVKNIIKTVQEVLNTGIIIK